MAASGFQSRKAISAAPDQIPEATATTIWSAGTRASAILFRATWHRATPKRFAMKAAASVRPGLAFISISPMPSAAWAAKTIEERYGNLFDMYQRITDEDPYKAPMRIYPAIHYTMGGLWVDYQLMSTIPGLFVIWARRTSRTMARTVSAQAR